MQKKYGTMSGYDENDIRAGFYVRIALTLFNGGSEKHCKEFILSACKISKEKTIEYINELQCDQNIKEMMKGMIAD